MGTSSRLRPPGMRRPNNVAAMSAFLRMRCFYPRSNEPPLNKSFVPFFAAKARVSAASGPPTMRFVQRANWLRP